MNVKPFPVRDPQIEPAVPADAPPPPAAPVPLWQRRRFLVGAGVLLALLALAIAWVVAQRMGSTPPPTSTATQSPLVTVVVPGRAPVARTVSFTGAIAARYDMPIGIEGEGGRIAAVLVEAGDRVRAGQVLARLTTTVVAPQVASLRAQLEQARAEATLAEAEYRRAETIASSIAALSQSDVDRRRSQLATANARVQSVAAQLAEAEGRLGRTEIRAPADGIVLTRTAEVGQTATAATPALFRLGRGGEVEMRGQVAEQDLPRVRVGQGVQVRVTGVDEPFEGEVRLLGAVIDPATRLGEIRVALEPHPDLRPGAFARGEVVTDRSPRPVVPQTAVLADAAGSYVMVVEADGRAVRRPVTIVGMTSAGAIVGEGLEGTEQVVAMAGAFLRDGETVRTELREAAPAAATAAQ